jgi:hypothetical protein
MTDPALTDPALTDPAFLRGEAERCRQMAARSSGTATAKRWRALADEYLQLALASDESTRNARRSNGRPASTPKPNSSQAQL